jgi:hypothetical protein
MIDLPKNIRYPFIIYDIFGYLLPGLVFCVLLLLTSDIPLVIHKASIGVLPEGFSSKSATAYDDRTTTLLQRKAAALDSLHSNARSTYDSLRNVRVISSVDKALEGSPFRFTLFIGYLHKSPWFVSLFCLLVAYVSGHILSTASSYFLERVLVEKILFLPGDNMFRTEEKIFWLFNAYRRSYPSSFIEPFKNRFELNIGLEWGNVTARERYWLCFHYIKEHSPEALLRVMHFLNLYGFARNLSMAFLSTSGMIAAILYFSGAEFGVDTIVLLLAYVVVAIGLFWNYLKLLRRHNDEIFRSFYIITKGYRVPI